MSLAADLSAERLFIAGALHDGDETLLLLGPDEPGFWAHVTASPEFADGTPDPLDRWSARVIGALATAHGGRALFPFQGPPFLPFFDWALRSGQAWHSPLPLMVHARMGLWASLRGAVALPGHLALPSPAPRPCNDCTAPCATACPVGALSPAGYDVPACHAFLNTPDGENCLSSGCLARRACPIAQSYGRLPQQSAWHMRHFHR